MAVPSSSDAFNDLDARASRADLAGSLMRTALACTRFPSLRRVAAVFLCVAAGAATLSFSSAAHAGDVALAESLFREGRALMQAGNYRTACPKLKESYAQDPATGTLLALAVCQEEIGKTASAWTAYAEAAVRAKREGTPERERAARERQKALEPKLSRLTVNVSAEAAAIDGLVVRRDGLEMGSGAWGSAAAIDPGKHVVEASAPGRHPWRTTVTVGPDADAQTIDVPILEEAPQMLDAPPPAMRGAAEDRDDDGGLSLRTMGLVTGAVGIVGLAVGGFFGIRAMSLGEESDAGCDDRSVCDEAGFSKREDATTAATISTVAFIAGGVLTAAGVTLFVVDGHDGAREDAARVRVSPVVLPGTAAMSVEGRF